MHNTTGADRWTRPCASFNDAADLLAACVRAVQDGMRRPPVEIIDSSVRIGKGLPFDPLCMTVAIVDVGAIGVDPGDRFDAEAGAYAAIERDEPVVVDLAADGSDSVSHALIDDQRDAC